MRSGNSNFRWDILILVLLVGIDVLVGLRAVQRLVLHQGQISPDAPFFLLFLLVLQVAVIVVFDQWKRTLAQHSRLRETYEHELELSRQIMENIPSAIAVVDSEGRFVYVNRASSELLELPSEAIEGQTADALVAWPTGQSQATTWPDPLTEPMRVPVTLRTSSGKTVAAIVNVSPRWFGGRVVGAIASTIPTPNVPAETVPTGTVELLEVQSPSARRSSD